MWNYNNFGCLRSLVVIIARHNISSGFLSATKNFPLPSSFSSLFHRKVFVDFSCRIAAALDAESTKPQKLHLKTFSGEIMEIYGVKNIFECCEMFRQREKFSVQFSDSLIQLQILWTSTNPERNKRRKLINPPNEYFRGSLSTAR